MKKIFWNTFKHLGLRPYILLSKVTAFHPTEPSKLTLSHNIAHNKAEENKPKLDCSLRVGFRLKAEGKFWERNMRGNMSYSWSCIVNSGERVSLCNRKMQQKEIIFSFQLAPRGYLDKSQTHSESLHYWTLCQSSYL